MLSKLPVLMVWISLALSVHLHCATACCRTSPTEYASAVSAAIASAVPPFLAMYACTNCLLAELLRPGHQLFGNKIPSVLAAPTPCEKAAPVSGPLVKMIALGL